MCVLFDHLFTFPGCAGGPNAAGALHTALMWKEMVSSMMDCFKTDPIISRPLPGSGCKRHNVLELNPVSAENLTLLIGSVIVCEHLGPNCLPSKYTVWN